MKRTLIAALLASGALAAASSSFAGEDDVTSTIPSISATGLGSTPVVTATPGAGPYYFGEQDVGSSLPVFDSTQTTPVLAAPNAAPYDFGEPGVHSAIPDATQRGSISVITRGEANVHTASPSGENDVTSRVN